MGGRPPKVDLSLGVGNQAGVGSPDRGGSQGSGPRSFKESREGRALGTLGEPLLRTLVHNMLGPRCPGVTLASSGCWVVLV